MAKRPRSTVSRRDLLKLGGAAAATGALASALDLARPDPADAQTPKRGGTFRIATLLDPVGWDPRSRCTTSTTRQ